MTANDNARDEYDGVDALLAAITDEPLPEEARADAVFMAGHRAATADVALLREQLAIIGEALGAEPAAEVRRVRQPRPVRRRHPGLRALALGAMAIVVAATMVAGLAWLVSLNGGGATSESGASKSDSDAAANKAAGDGGVPSDPELAVACSGLLVEGTVAQVRPEPDPRKRITLTVTRYYRPGRGPAQVTFILDGGAKPAPSKGQHVLVGVPSDSDAATLWAVGDDRVAANRAWIVKALPGSRHVTCPSEAPTDKP